MNERYSTDKHVGVSRKSAASAKPKNKAAASVTVGSRKKTPQERKAEQKAARREATEKQREIDRKYYKPDTERYKKLRRLWWICLVAGVVSVIIAYVLRTVEPQWIPTAALILAYAFIIFAFYLDFSKIRKERRAYQQKMLLLEQMQEREAKQREAEARQKANHKGRRGGKGKVSSAQTANAEEDAQETASEQTDAETVPETPANKVMSFFRKKPPQAE